MRLNALTLSALASATLAALNAAGYITIPWLYTAAPIALYFSLLIAFFLALVVVIFTFVGAIFILYAPDNEAASAEVKRIITETRAWIERHTPSTAE